MAWFENSGTDPQDLLVEIRDDVEAGNWSRDRYATSVNDSNNDEWIAHATNVTGNDAPYIGIRTYLDSTSGAWGFELAGGTGYDSGASEWGNYITGISPGRYDGATADLQYGAYVPLTNSSMNYWLSVTDRRIAGVIQVDTGYFAFYLGLLDTFADSTAYPFPMYVGGCMTRFDSLYSDGTPDIGSTLADPIAYRDGATEKPGPHFLRFTDGAWYSVRNSFFGSGSRVVNREVVVTPPGLVDITGLTDPADEWQVAGTNIRDFQQVIPATGVPGTETARIHKTDGTTDNVPIFPSTVVMQVPSEQFIGELAGIYWCSGADGVGSEDVLGSGTTYTVFQGGTQSNLWRRMAILEA